MRRFFIVTCFIVVSAFSHASAESARPFQKKTTKSQPVSYYRQIRPIMQRYCSGCHQPAKAGGKLSLTSYDELKKGGEDGETFEAGKPDDSLLIEYISGDKPEMPLKGEKLSKDQVAIIARWIAEGAKDDTPPNMKVTVSEKNPPKYLNSPVITALAYSPDSKILAVSGFHEVLLHQADGTKRLARLIGRSLRIESIRFSPDGKTLGVVGGSPTLFGEVQFWNLAKRKLLNSRTVAFDCLFGGSFSSDGKLFAFGAADNRARVFQVKNAKQIMRFDAHSDYVLGTTFSLKNDHLISISRDMSMKLIVVKNAQFVDNITSITPGALKGGLMAVQRHPKKDQVLTAGADGTPKLYKIFRTRKRIIGDDFNQIRSYQKMPGRIFDLQFNGDGTMFVAGSSTATGGAARIYKTGDYHEKDVNNAGSLQQARVETAKRSAVKMLLHELKGIDSPIFAVAFRPDGKQVAVGGFDGFVRLFDVASGKLIKKFLPVELERAIVSVHAQKPNSSK